MSRSEFRKVSQRDFVREVREKAPRVAYEYPGIFRAGRREVRVKFAQVGNFLAKLGPAMSFQDYDRLTREVWVTHMRAEDATGPPSPKPVARRYPRPGPE